LLADSLVGVVQSLPLLKAYANSDGGKESYEPRSISSSACGAVWGRFILLLGAARLDIVFYSLEALCNPAWQSVLRWGLDIIVLLLVAHETVL